MRVLPKDAKGRWPEGVKTMCFSTGSNSKKADKGTFNANANCWSVLTEGEDFPFSIKLRVLIFKPL